MGEKEEYTEDQIKEYKLYIDLAERFAKQSFSK